MQRVVFLIYHGAGHFNACFRLAKIFTQANYEVFFAGHRYFQPHVTSQDFEYIPLSTVPFGQGFESWVNTMDKKKNVYWHSLKDRITDRLYFLREAELNKLLAVLKPDYLLIDAWQATDFIVLYPFLKRNNIRAALIQTMLPTVMEPDLPPLNSIVTPKNEKEIRKAQRKFVFKSLKDTITQKLKYLGNDNDRQIERRWKINQIPLRYRSEKKSLFTITLENVPEFVLAPAELDFPSRFRSSFRQYVGFLIDDTRNERPNETFQSALKLLEERKNSGVNSHLIYCSFGTLPVRQKMPVLQFLQRLISVTSKTENVLMISIEEEIRTQLESGNKRVFIASSLPQLKILSHASVMITHGGLNSIKESIAAGVPLLVYPMDNRMDQFGNAARITYHQLGSAGDYKRDTEADIAEKILMLLRNPVFRENIIKMKIHNARYTEEDLLTRFRNIPQLL